MKTLVLLLFCLSSVIVFSQPDKEYVQKEQRKAFYEKVSKKYNSAVIREIFNSDKDFLFENYIDGHTEYKLINSYSTVIHELLHGYNNSEMSGHHYLVDSGESIFVQYGKYYNSKELNSYVRKGQQDSIFRYGIYVGAKKDIPGHKGGHQGINASEKSEVFSIAKGICGLLEEYCAYYFGNLAMYEAHGYFLDNYGDTNPKAWKDYKHEIYSDLLAYYEFNLFMAWYVIYAKEKHPDVYNDIQTNKPLRVIFTLLSDKFKKLSEEIEKQMVAVNKTIGPDFMEVIDFSGSDDDLFRFLEIGGMKPNEIYKEEATVVNGKSIMMKKSILSKENYTTLKAEYKKAIDQIKKQVGGDLMLYFAQPKLQIAYLKRQFTPELKAELEKLRIEEVTIVNYKAYLK